MVMVVGDISAVDYGCARCSACRNLFLRVSLRWKKTLTVMKQANKSPPCELNSEN